jgi:hypothetical protein
MVYLKIFYKKIVITAIKIPLILHPENCHDRLVTTKDENLSSHHALRITHYDSHINPGSDNLMKLNVDMNLWKV